MRELQCLVGGRIDKSFQTGDEVRIRVHSRGAGQGELVVIPGRSVHLSRTRRAAPSQASPLAMQLRKHLGGLVVRAVRQHGFDRIVELDMGERVLVLELFSKGNVVLTAADGTILGVLERQRWRDREVLHGRRYEYPPCASADPTSLDEDSFAARLAASGRDAVRALAVDIGLGGRYAEEVCLRAGVEKGAEPTPELAARLYQALRAFIAALDGPLAPYVPSGAPPSPVELALDAGSERTRFATFNEALDHYYAEEVGGSEAEEARSRCAARVASLEETLRRQERLLEGFRAAAEEDRRRGDAIFANLQRVERVLADVRDARHRLGWAGIKERLEEGRRAGVPEALAVVEVDEREGRLVLELEGPP